MEEDIFEFIDEKSIIVPKDSEIIKEIEFYKKNIRQEWQNYKEVAEVRTLALDVINELYLAIFNIINNEILNVNYFI